MFTHRNTLINKKFFELQQNGQKFLKKNLIQRLVIRPMIPMSYVQSISMVSHFQNVRF